MTRSRTLTGGFAICALWTLADIAMVFVRCRGGVSHHPDEHVDVSDADAGARVLFRLIENFMPRHVA